MDGKSAGEKPEAASDAGEQTLKTGIEASSQVDDGNGSGSQADAAAKDTPFKLIAKWNGKEHRLELQVRYGHLYSMIPLSAASATCAGQHSVGTGGVEKKHYIL